MNAKKIKDLGVKLENVIHSILSKVSYEEKAKLLDVLSEFDELSQVSEEKLKQDPTDFKFLKNLSEELRTPLNKILGVLEIMQITDLNKDQRQWVKTIDISSHSILSTICNLTDFSEVNKNEINSEHKDFNLKQVIHHVISDFSFKIDDKELYLENKIETGLKHLIKGDPRRLRELLNIMISKAINFTKMGSINLLVSKDEETKSKIKIRFEIISSNKSLSDDQVNQIMSDGEHGVCMSKNLLGLMNGESGVQWDEGVGVSLWFTGTFYKQLSLKKKKIKLLNNLKGMHVLIVDNSNVRREYLKKHLRSWQCKYDEAKVEKEALDKIMAKKENDSKYNFILVQHANTGINGFEFSKSIQEKVDLNKTPMVMLTSCGKRGDAAIALKLGYGGYLTSPVSESQLFECMLNIIEMDNFDEDKTFLTKYDL